MSENKTFSQEELALAASQEENIRLQAQIKHLSERTVLLRALVNRLANENAQEETDDGSGTEDLGTDGS